MINNIRIKETIEDANSLFNIKRLRMFGIDFDLPCKALDVKEITQAYNAVKINEEFRVQSENFLRDMTIVNNLGGKTMLTENGGIRRALTKDPAGYKKLIGGSRS